MCTRPVKGAAVGTSSPLITTTVAAEVFGRSCVCTDGEIRGSGIGSSVSATSTATTDIFVWGQREPA